MFLGHALSHSSALTIILLLLSPSGQYFTYLIGGGTSVPAKGREAKRSKEFKVSARPSKGIFTVPPEAELSTK